MKMIRKLCECEEIRSTNDTNKDMYTDFPETRIITLNFCYTPKNVKHSISNKFP